MPLIFLPGTLGIGCLPGTSRPCECYPAHIAPSQVLRALGHRTLGAFHPAHVILRSHPQAGPVHSGTSGVQGGGVQALGLPVGDVC